MVFTFGRYFCVHVFACIQQVYFPWDIGRLSFYLAGFRVFGFFLQLAVVVFIHVNFVAAGFSYSFHLGRIVFSVSFVERRNLCEFQEKERSIFIAQECLCWPQGEGSESLASPGISV